MREQLIKYRAFHIATKRMYEVLSIDFEHRMIACPCKDNCETGVDGFSFDEVELLEYIGLPDRHGAEIYEGDICLYAYADSENPWPWVVVWCDGKHEYLRAPLEWVFADYKHTIRLAAESTLEHPEEYVDAEIIGNIWEHPHLNPRDEQIFWQDVANHSEDNLWWKSLLVQTHEIATIDEEPSL